jgi:very-short-patch-repair endonuclease
LDWSNLQADYERLGTQRAVAEFYGCRQQLVAKAMKRLGIKAKPVKGRSYTWTDERKAKHKAACNTPEFKEAHRVSLLKRFDELRGPSADSPLEKLLHGALKRAGLSFTTQRRKLGRYVVDIELLQAPIVIEADGLSHRLERRMALDKVRDAALVEAGYQVYRFNGTEINADPDACVRSVMDAAGLVPDTDPIAEIRRGGRGEDNPNWKGAQTEHTCSGCGNTFVEHRANRTYKKKFCNQKCYGAWMRAHPEQSPVHARWKKHREQQVVA